MTRSATSRRLLSAAAALVLAGCSPLFDDGASRVGEVRLEIDGRYWQTLYPGRLASGLAMAVDSEVDLRVVPLGENGTPLAGGVADSAAVLVGMAHQATWTPTGDFTGILAGHVISRASLRVDVFRDGQVVWRSAVQPLEIRCLRTPATPCSP